MKKPNVSELSLTEKVAHLLMIRQDQVIYKWEDGKTVRRPIEEVHEIMKKYQYGSMWVQGGKLMNGVDFGENDPGEIQKAKHTKKWLDDIQKDVRLPMLFGCDSENGMGYSYSDCTVTVGAYSIGAADDLELTTEISAAIAREHRAAGTNWRWAPVADIPNRFNAVRNGRGFSDDVDKLSAHIKAAIKGLAQENVVSTVKHFPGCDPYEFRDPHFVTDMINLSIEEWEKTQGKAFQNAVDDGVMSIMTSHTAWPMVDDEIMNGKPVPATMSKKIITGILRKKMGFEGVIVTDGMDMAGLTNMCSRKELLARAINAGHDVLIGTNLEDFEYLYEAVCEGIVPMERVDDACRRILDLKEKIGLFDDNYKNDYNMETEQSKTSEINRKVAEKSLTLLYDRNNLLPVNRDNIKKVAIVCSSHFPDTIKRLEVMKAEFEKRGARAVIYDDIKYGEQLTEMDKECDLIIYAGYLAPHRPMGVSALSGEKCRTYLWAFSKGKEKSIGISMGYPYMHIDTMQGADTFVNVYSPDAETLTAFVKAVYGEIDFVGKSPVDIEPKLRYVYC